MYIYKTTNLINGKIYIGKTTRTCEYSKENYMGSGTYIQMAFKKYGKENFKKEILEYADNKAHLSKLEPEYIRKYKSADMLIGYNLITDGTSDVISGTKWYHNPETGVAIRTKASMPSPWVYGQRKSTVEYEEVKCKECSKIFMGEAKHNRQYCSISCSSLNKPSNTRPRYNTKCELPPCNNQVENWEGTKRLKRFCSVSCAVQFRGLG